VLYDRMGEARQSAETLTEAIGRDPSLEGAYLVLARAPDGTHIAKSEQYAKQALEIARSRGRFTIFSLVDALTRLSGELKFVGDRIEADQKASSLLALAA
jgi:hypothetical protein